MLVIGIGSSFIYNIYSKWSTQPIIMTANSKAISISDIPFPAVTICNMNQAQHNAVEHIRKGSHDDYLLHSVCFKRDTTTAFSSNFTGKWTEYQEFMLNVHYLVS